MPNLSLEEKDKLYVQVERARGDGEDHHDSVSLGEDQGGKY